MNFRLTEEQLAHLQAVGAFIDGDRRPTVFDGGFVGFSDATGSEVMKDVAERQEAGSQSGSRPGQRARARRPEATDHAFRSDAIERIYGTEFRILAQHYDALAFEDRSGLWVVVTSAPLGKDGPEVHLLIAIPTDHSFAPRSWAFHGIGRHAEIMSLKHTNFPDASICAFAHGSWPWPNPDGLLGLVDIYLLWIIRKLHRDHFGWWPGPQVGACSYYRLREFDAREDCGCGSKKRYGKCHMPSDLLANPVAAEAQFRRLFGCEFGERRAPESVTLAARTHWTRIPSMAAVFAYRPDLSGSYLI